MSGPSFDAYSIFNPPTSTRVGGTSGQESEMAGLQESVDALIRSFRSRGHIVAQVDPLLQPKASPPELDPAYHGLTDRDL